MASSLKEMKACNSTKIILHQKFFPGNFLKISEQPLWRIDIKGCFHILRSVWKAYIHLMTFPLANEDKIFLLTTVLSLLVDLFLCFQSRFGRLFFENIWIWPRTGCCLNHCDRYNLIEIDYIFLASKMLYKVLKYLFILELWHVKWMETTVLKTKTVTCITFDMQVNFYCLWYANSFLLLLSILGLSKELRCCLDLWKL